MADADLSFPQFASQQLDVLVAIAPDRGIRLRTGPGHVTDLGEGVRVEVLPHKLAEAVLDACSYPGRWRSAGRATRQFDALCAFVRVTSPDPTPTIQWDRSKAISTATILSRLVRPNPVGYEYACRISFDDEGTVEMIAPGCHPGPGSSAYVHDSSRRVWLDQTDLLNLAALGDALRAWPLPRPPAFMRALRYHEMAYWQWDVRRGLRARLRDPRRAPEEVDARGPHGALEEAGGRDGGAGRGSAGGTARPRPGLASRACRITGAT